MRKETLDQLLKREPAAIFDRESLAPHDAVPCFVTFEPNTHAGTTRVRVTARDADLNLLWGVNVSEPLIRAEHPTPVAVYGALRELVRKSMSNSKPKFEFTSDPYASISTNANKIKQMLAAATESTVGVKNKSTKTDERAGQLAALLQEVAERLTHGLNETGIGTDVTTPPPESVS